MRWYYPPHFCFYYFFKDISGSDGILNQGMNLSQPVNVKINIENTATIAITFEPIYSNGVNVCIGKIAFEIAT